MKKPVENFQQAFTFLSFKIYPKISATLAPILAGESTT